MKCQWPLHPRPEELDDKALDADRWKCNRPTRPGEHYCEEHIERAAYRPPMADPDASAA